MRLIIDIPEDVYTRLFDNGIKDNEITTDDICEMARVLRLGIPIPDNATNGDVIKVMFPQAYISKDINSYVVEIEYDGGDSAFSRTYPIDWWNSPYQKGGKERDYDAEYRNHSEMILNAQKVRNKG